jgi:hypothetical protein
MISLEIGETIVELSLAALEASAGDRMGGQVDRRGEEGGERRERRGGEGREREESGERVGGGGGGGVGVGGGWGDGVGEGEERSAVGECGGGGWVLW